MSTKTRRYIVLFFICLYIVGIGGWPLYLFFSGVKDAEYAIAFIKTNIFWSFGATLIVGVLLYFFSQQSSHPSDN